MVTASAPNGVTTDNTPQLGYTKPDVNPDRVECTIDPVDPLSPASYTVCPAIRSRRPRSPTASTSCTSSGYDLAQRLSVAVKVFTIDSTGPAITVTGISEGEVIASAWPPISVSWTTAAPERRAGPARTTRQYRQAARTRLPQRPALRRCAHAQRRRHGSGRQRHHPHGQLHDRHSGGLTSGPCGTEVSAKFAVKSGKLKGAKYPTASRSHSPCPPGSPANASAAEAQGSTSCQEEAVGCCEREVQADQLVSASPPGRRSCRRSTRARRLSIVLAYKSGPIKAFTALRSRQALSVPSSRVLRPRKIRVIAGRGGNGLCRSGARPTCPRAVPTAATAVTAETSWSSATARCAICAVTAAARTSRATTATTARATARHGATGEVMVLPCRPEPEVTRPTGRRSRAQRAGRARDRCARRHRRARQQAVRDRHAAGAALRRERAARRGVRHRPAPAAARGRRARRAAERR